MLLARSSLLRKLLEGGVVSTALVAGKQVSWMPGVRRTSACASAASSSLSPCGLSSLGGVSGKFARVCCVLCVCMCMYVRVCVYVCVYDSPARGDL